MYSCAKKKEIYFLTISFTIDISLAHNVASSPNSLNLTGLFFARLTLLIFTVKVQRKNCISHQITAFKLHLDYSSVNSKIEEKSYKTLIFSQPKYCYWINVKIIFKNCKV